MDKFEIKKHLLSLPSEGKYHKELNLVSWAGRAPKYDLRGWDDEHKQMTKGVTLTPEELKIFKDKLGGIKL